MQVVVSSSAVTFPLCSAKDASCKLFLHHWLKDRARLFVTHEGLYNLLEIKSDDSRTFKHYVHYIPMELHFQCAYRPSNWVIDVRISGPHQNGSKSVGRTKWLDQKHNCVLLYPPSDYFHQQNGKGMSIRVETLYASGSRRDSMCGEKYQRESGCDGLPKVLF